MTRYGKDLSRMLRWYPATWRERYGDEMVALMEDELAGRRPDLRLRLSTAWSGVRERAHETGLVASGAPLERLRAGSVLVLFSWAVFVLAGISFSKIAEHFAQALPSSARPVAQHAFDVVAVLGVAGVAIVIVGTVVALGPLTRYVRGGGWVRVRRSVHRAVATSVVLLGATVGLVVWAHHLNSLQRNGHNVAYVSAFLLCGLLFAAVLAQWTQVAARWVRLVPWRSATLRVEAALAVALGVVMATITIAAAVWWSSIGLHAPWFLRGSRVGVAVSAFTPSIVATMTLMAGAGALGVVGVTRIARTWVTARDEGPQ